MENNNDVSKTNEIDFIGLAKQMLADKKSLGISVLVFAVLGVVVALNTPKEYTSKILLAPEYSAGTKLSGSLGDIASMMGVDLGNVGGNSVDAIYPQIYPEVIGSSDFIVPLFDAKVQGEKDTTTKTYYDHLTKDVHIPFWAYPQMWITSLFAKKEPTGYAKLNMKALTREQDGVFKIIRKNVLCTVDKKTNVISIAVTDNDRKIAATMADTIQNSLQRYITMYRTRKVRKDMEYYQKIYDEAYARYKKSQEVYASYSDANVDVVLQSFASKRDELENQMQLNYNIYTQATQQLQLAKAKVQERTPVFSVVQSATMPIRASSTPRSFMVIAFCFIGVIADALWIFILKDKFRKQK